MNVLLAEKKGNVSSGLAFGIGGGLISLVIVCVIIWKLMR